MHLEGKKVLITGGAGLIGSHIADQLVQEGAEVIAYDNLIRGKPQHLEWASAHGQVELIQADITEAEALKKAMSGVDYCFHEAAAWLLACQDDPQLSITVNIQGTFNVLMACVEAGVKKIVAASSSSVYGDGSYFPTDEAHPFNNELFYGAAKVANEQYYRCFKKKYGLDYVAFRYLNIWGPRQPFMAAYTDVINHFFNRLDQNLPPQIHGDGTATLDLVFVEDCARANLMALKSPVSGEVFNVSSGKETTLNEMAEAILRVTGRSELKPEYIPRDAKLVVRRFGSAKKAKEMLGFETQISLDEGLKKVLAYREAEKSRAARQG
jgi:UDP-glucose 4-epimerase